MQINRHFVMASLVAEMPEQEKNKIIECIEKIETIVSEYEDYGLMAMALLAAKLVKGSEQLI